MLDSRWTGFDLFSVQLLCEFLNSCWTHVGFMLDGCWAPLSVFGTRTGHFDTCWTHVGLALDSRWTVFDLFLVQFLVQLFDIMLDSCWTRWTLALCFLYKN